MKNLLLLTALLFGLFSQAQDYNYIKELNSLSKSEARAFSDAVAAASSTKWVYLYEKSSDDSRADWYIDSSLPPAVIEATRQGKETVKLGQCMRVRYTLVGDKYRFNEVTARVKDLMPTWQHYFKPDATLENITVKYTMQELMQKESGISYKLKKADEPDYWTLKNWTYLKN